MGWFMSWPKQRAWGWYATLIRTPWFCLKLLRFKPYGQLSMQRHMHRTEIWYVIKTWGMYERFNVIRPNQWHTFKAFQHPVYAIEFQYGKKVTESDIERK